jgi:hypothetical protein
VRDRLLQDLAAGERRVNASNRLGVDVDTGTVRDEIAGSAAEGEGSDRRRGRPRRPLRPDPGEPPDTRPTSATPLEIEFVPQGPTRWMEPKLLALMGVQVALSTKFAEFFDRRDAHAGVLAHLPETTQPGADHDGGRHVDRSAGGVDPVGRWSLTETAQGFDFTGADELWLDYIADSGDGFDATTTIASVAARDSLTLSSPAGDEPAGVHETRAGVVLVLGGDQAYPFATMEEYRNRLVGPFRSVLPWTWNPRWLFAIPGNHDWYDGLASFVKQFCQGRWIGGWRSTQTRSYFALALPHNWHLWAVDVALGTDVDTGQLDYFEERARALEPGAQIVLCAAKPTWTATYHDDPTAPDVLDYFERTVIGDRAALRLTLAGDLHLYARYTSANGESKIIAGGGGAYLAPTHHLASPVRHPSPDTSGAASGEAAKRFELRQVFPTKDASRRLRGRIFWQIYRNRGFFVVTAAAYALVAMAVPADRIFDPAGWLQTVAALLPVTLAGLVVFAALYAFTLSAQASRRRKRAAATLHTALHLAVVVGAVDLLLQLNGVAASDPWMRAVLGAAVGALVGPLVVAGYLWSADHFHVNSNELYAGCANEAYKNFLRLHIDHTGLTVYPIGVRLPTGWTFDSDTPGEAPRDRTERGQWAGLAWFRPRRSIEPELIEKPVHIPPRQRPAAHPPDVHAGNTACEQRTRPDPLGPPTDDRDSEP